MTNPPLIRNVPSEPKPNTKSPEATSVASSSEASILSNRRFGRRLFRSTVAPFLFVYRRPGRAALLAGAILLFLIAVIVAGGWIWFDFHLRAARQELDKGHNAEAIRHIQLCRWVRPEHREVLLLSACAARRAGSWDEADNLLNTYSERYGDEEPLVFERLLYRAARGDLETTGSALHSRIERGGIEARLSREALVNGLTYRFRWGEAKRLLDYWLQETPDDTLPLLLKGKYFEQQFGYDEALQAYRRVIELDPDQLEARLRLATLLIARRYGEEAAEQLVVLRERLPNHAEIQVLWVKALALLGRTDEAHRAIESCLQSHPNYPPALLERGRIALVDGDEAKAEEDLALAARLDPGNIQIRTQYALALGRNNKPTQATEQYDKAHQLETDAERILQLIRGPLQTSPNDPELHYEIGMIALRCGLAAEAIRWFTSALQVDPNHLPSHRVFANIYRELDKPALAAKHRAIAQQLSVQQGKR